MIKHSIGVFFIALTLVLAACGGVNKKGVSEGKIEFDAVPVDKTSPLADMVPKAMTVKFKNNKTYAEMSSAMGLLTIRYISDFEAKTLTQLVKVVYKNNLCIQNADGIDAELKEKPKMKIQQTNDTKVIAGYKCKKAIISYDDPKITSFDVYYTDEIGLEGPNWFNEFREIEGVLLEYQLKRYNIELRFTAKSVTAEPVSDDSFKVPDDEYRQVTQKELEEIFSALQ